MSDQSGGLRSWHRIRARFRIRLTGRLNVKSGLCQGLRDRYDRSAMPEPGLPSLAVILKFRLLLTRCRPSRFR